MQPFITRSSAAAARQGRRIAAAVERSERGGLMVIAALIGVITGLAAVAFGGLIDLSHWFFFDIIDGRLLGGLPRARLLLVPALGGLLVGPLVVKVAREARGQGVSDVMLALETQQGRIRARVAPVMALASSLTIGSGGSVGRQGPVVQIGAGLASTVARFARLSGDNVRLLVAAGVAGGVAAEFNAPIAGVFFALEVVLRSINTRNFSVVMIAALAATATSEALLGDKPAIGVPEYGLETVAEIPLYALLGVTAAVVGVLFVRTIHGVEDRLSALPLRSPMLLPAVGGLCVGALALINEGVLGEGEELMGDILSVRSTMGTMLLLLLLKPLATAFSIGSGASGGLFRPSLLIGALAGGIFGAAVNGLLPAVAPEPGAYATAGMAAMFAAISHAPISAVLMLFEMTRDYGLMLPLMTSVAAATFTSQMLASASIYTAGLARRGVLIEEEPGPVSVMASVAVADAMSPVTATVEPDTPAGELVLALRGDPDAAVLVLDGDGALAGVITNMDVTELIAAGGLDRPASEIAARGAPSVFADQTLHEALGIFAAREAHVLPVVTREHPEHPCGILRRSDITRAYAAAVDRSDAASRRRRLAPVTGDQVRYLELRVAPESGLHGCPLNELNLTEDAVIVAVRHQGVTLIPRGHTRLAVGDQVTVIVTAAAAPEVRAQFAGHTQ